MKRRLVLILTVVAAFIVIMPRSAGADTLLTPFAGITFGGDASNGQPLFGGSIAFMGGGILGGEVDYAYYPDFFDIENEFSFLTDSHIQTFMANLIIGAPLGVVRPYVVGGVGLLHARATGLFDNVSNSDFGFDVGAGLIGFFSDNVGIRGDIRYFRALRDPQEDNEFDIALGSFNFMRGTIGVTFRF
jgi:opacity protein-like surface antigen